MQKVISINLNGNAYQVEETGTLRWSSIGPCEAGAGNRHRPSCPLPATRRAWSPGSWCPSSRSSARCSSGSARTPCCHWRPSGIRRPAVRRHPALGRHPVSGIPLSVGRMAAARGAAGAAPRARRAAPRRGRRAGRVAVGGRRPVRCLVRVSVHPGSARAAPNSSGCVGQHAAPDG